MSRPPLDPADVAGRNGEAVELFGAGRIEEAVEAWETLLADCARLLGPDHADTLVVAGNHACAVSVTGAPESVHLMEGALASRERVLGPEHPATLNAVDAVAALYRSRRLTERAVAFSIRAVDLRSRVLGPTHVQTIVSRLGLAQARADAGDVLAAQVVLDATLHDALSTCGPRSVVTAEIRATIGSLHGAAGHADRARAELAEALSVIEGQLGRSHPDTVALRGELDALVG